MSEPPYVCDKCGEHVQPASAALLLHKCLRPHRHDQILSLRASGHVKRWHTIRTITQQTVAEHSGQALTLLLMLHPDPSIRLIRTVLWHDSSERVAGDVPAPMRRAFPSFAKQYEEIEEVVAMRWHPEALETLNDEEQRWLKAVDTLELFLHAHDECRLGNCEFHIIFQRAKNYLMTLTTPPEVVKFVEWFLVEGCTRSFA